MVEQIINKVLEKVPEHLDGIDRHVTIADEVEALPDEEVLVLKKKANEFLYRMRDLDASDIELGGAKTQNSIWFRIQGVKAKRQELGEWTPEQTDIICHSLISEKQRERLFIYRVVDFSYTLPYDEGMYRWRATLYMDLGHCALNMRAISAEVFPYNRLGFHSNISRMFSLSFEKQGLVLFTGITGSGKSTSMDSIIDANNQLVKGHITIIGDPIEFIHESKKCIVRHREVGKDVGSFKEGAVQSLRQDPDIIVIGEMRDPETIMTCLEVSDTGHKVFSTLHTGSAIETIDRIVAECPTEEQDRVRVRLADQLRVVVSQKLIPDVTGRLALAKEVLLVTSPVKAAIRNKNIHEIYQMISESGKLGMIALEQDLVRLYGSGIITKETAFNYANNKKRFQELAN